MNESKTSLITSISRRLDTRQGKRWLLMGTAVLLGLLIFKSIKPAMSDRSAAAVEQASVQASTKKLQDNINTLTPQLRKQKNSDLPQMLNTALPAKAVADQQLSLLSRLANQTNVELPTFEPGNPDGSGSVYQTVPVSLAIKGTLENCLRFLSGLHQMVRVRGGNVTAYGPVWQVQQVGLAPGEDGQTSITMSANYFVAGAKSKSGGNEQ